nr:unnamed protein product [Digitaria exilis]
MGPVAMPVALLFEYELPW